MIILYTSRRTAICLPSLPSQSASEKHNQEKKAHKPLGTSWISPKNCLPCLISKHSRSDYRINFSHALAGWSAFRALFTWDRRTCTTCAKDQGLFILITHKSPRSEIVSHGCRCALNLHVAMGCARIHVSVRAWCLTFKFCPKYDYDRLSMPFIYLLNFQWLIAIPEKLVHMPRKQRHVCYTCTVHRNFME